LSYTLSLHDALPIFAPFENISAILAGILVPFENVVPGDLHFLFWQSIEQQQDDHAWDTDLPRNRGYHLSLGRLRGKIAPAIEVVSQEIICAISGDDLGVSGIDQGKSPACRADVHRLPETVKHQDLTVQ